MRQYRLIVVVTLFAAANLACADDVPLIEPLMTERGKLLLSQDFTKPLDKGWTTAKGKWEIVDGVLRGSELPSDNHGAVTRYAMPFGNVMIQFSFKLEGAKLTTLSINKEKGHLSRVRISPLGIAVQKDDQDGKKGPDKAQVLDTRAVKIAPGVWHTLLLELHGNDILASLDGKEVAFGSHDTLNAPKANFGLTVAGDGVSFKNLRVWQAQPNASWPATREKLLKTRQG